MALAVSGIRSDLALTGSFSFSRMRTYAPNAVGQAVSMSAIKTGNLFKGLLSFNSAANSKSIKTNTGTVQDGFYWVTISGTPTKVFCLMDNKFDSGGWMAVTSTISPQTSNAIASAAWESNAGARLDNRVTQILNVSIVGVNCGGNSFYLLRNPSAVGVSYSESLLLMERVSTIGQCSAITAGVFSGWFSGPLWAGAANSSGACLWDNGVWANVCCDSNNMANLKKYWAFKSLGTNPDLRYNTQCGGDNGQHYHMWFVK